MRYTVYDEANDDTRNLDNKGLIDYANTFTYVMGDEDITSVKQAITVLENLSMVVTELKNGKH